MKFSAKSANILAVLNPGLKLIEKTKTINIIADKKEVYLHMLGEGSSYFHATFPAKISKAGQFSISFDLFSSLLKAKTAELEYVVINNALSVTSLNSKFKGKDIALLSEEIKLADKSKKNALVLGKYQSKALILMNLCAIPSFFQKILPQNIMTQKGEIVITCADMLYAAIATFPAEKISIPSISIPSQHALLMKDVIGDNFALSMTNSKIIVDTDVLHAELPLLQVDAVASVSDIRSLEDSKKICSFTVETSVFKSELDQLLVIYEDKSPVKLSIKKNMALSYKTNHGQFNHSLPIENIKGQAEWYLDVEMLKTILSRCNGKIQVEVRQKVVTFVVVPIKNAQVRFIMSQVTPT
jgi:hypothetical protein